jgi:hypothetical protein
MKAVIYECKQQTSFFVKTFSFENSKKEEREKSDSQRNQPTSQSENVESIEEGRAASKSPH